MADRAWKQTERDAAALFGGKRHWANAGERLDFESDTAVGQVKLVRVLSLEALTKLAEEMEREALPKGKAGVVCVKVRRGKGRKSPMLVVVTAATWEAMNGKRTEQIAPAGTVWDHITEEIARQTMAGIPPDVGTPPLACPDCAMSMDGVGHGRSRCLPPFDYLEEKNR